MGGKMGTNESGQACPALVPLEASDRDWVYSDPEKDRERGCIGHLRFDQGSSGKEFRHSWWPHRDELNTPLFRVELDCIMKGLRGRGNPLSDRKEMLSYCMKNDRGTNCLEDGRSFGFCLETQGHRYLFRLNPNRGEYSYLYCYDKSAARGHGLSPAGRGMSGEKAEKRSRREKGEER